MCNRSLVNTSITVICLLGSFGLGACGGGGTNPTPSDPSPRPQGLLVPVGSGTALAANLKSAFTEMHKSAVAELVLDLQFTQVGDTAGLLVPPIAAEPVLSSATGSYSTTYTQEVEVDEFDIVKYDGEHMYIASSVGCCAGSGVDIAFDSNLSVLPPSGERAIRVLRTDPAVAGATEVARIELAEDLAVHGMYLTASRLVTLTSDNYFNGYGLAWTNIAPWTQQRSGLDIYDLGDVSAPKLLWRADIDGGFVQSRRVGDTLYLVTRFAPYLDDIIYNPASDAERSKNAALLDDVPIGKLVPKIRVNGQQRELLDPADCYVTNPDQSDGRQPQAVLTTITAIPIADPDSFKSVCYNETSYGVYVSSSAVYLHQIRYDSAAKEETTRIHKFRLKDMSYAGSAEVTGTLWYGGQLDFRASEHNDILRILTTSYRDDAADRWDHQLHMLREAVNKPELELLASLPNAAQPAEIGKPNEQLYGVRFFADRAFVVTFEQIDPLYVLDLSVPSAPRIAGELEVTGFSDFLHPVNESLLLGLGVGATGSIKLELFNVADLSAPMSLGAIDLGGRGSYSEAQYNRHAFTYVPGLPGEDTDRFAIPADLYSLDDLWQWQESGLYLFEIGNTSSPSSASLTAVGALVVDAPTATRRWPTGASHRSVLHDNAVYYVRDQTLWSSFWSDPATVLGPH